MKVKNIVEKGENAFSSNPTMFSEGLCFVSLEFYTFQQYFSYLTAAVHKSMFPGLFLTSS